MELLGGITRPTPLPQRAHALGLAQLLVQEAARIANPLVAFWPVAWRVVHVGLTRQAHKCDAA